ncbi:hypothetical protein TKK_0002580 [Trichogramma kaykai]
MDFDPNELANIDESFDNDEEPVDLVRDIVNMDIPDSEDTESTITDQSLEMASNCNDKPSTSNTQHVDKDDPRSKLHYVKYLNREGKTFKVWECGICSKEFRHQYTLMRHLPTHTDERNFKCDACGKAFRQLSTLSQHKAIHSDARPYVCEYCSKTFNRVSTLISHRKTHSEQKPHKCYICNKGFHQKGNLRNHIFTHTNERPYKCDICNKGFNQMSNLVCHKAKAHAHSEKMQYSCNICSQEFSRRFSLRAHEEFEHGIKYRHSNSTTSIKDPKSTERFNNFFKILNNSAKKFLIYNLYSTKNLYEVSSAEDDRFNSHSDSLDKELPMTEFMENILIDRIETKAMEAALLQEQTAFALFKPAKGIPVLVKVSPSGSMNHLLTPATADDLKMSGKMDESTQFVDHGQKSVQIKVPVVATVTEKVNDDGRTTFIIEPPGPDQEQVYSIQNLREKQSCSGRCNHRIFVHLFPFPLPLDNLITPIGSVSEYPLHTEEDFSLLEELISNEQAAEKVTRAPPVDQATDGELLEFAANEGIQFVRATEDGHYEVMTDGEARDLMTQNSHDFEILGTERTGFVDAVVEANQNIKNVHEQPLIQPEIIIPDQADIMVLDPNNDQKALTLGDIEILEDKDLKQLLGTKYSQEQFATNSNPLALLSQVKLNEILAMKPIDENSNNSFVDENMNSIIVPNEMSSILNDPNELIAIAPTAIHNKNFQLLEQPLVNSAMLQPSVSDIFDKPILRATEYPVIPECNSRMKMFDVEHDSEAMGLPVHESNGKILPNIYDGVADHCLQESSVNCQAENSLFMERNSMCKVDNYQPQVRDYTMVNPYGQFLQHSMYEPNYSLPCSFETLPYNMPVNDIDSINKKMQYFDKTYEEQFFPVNGFENHNNNEQNLSQVFMKGSFEHDGIEMNVMSNIENYYDDGQDRGSIDPEIFLQKYGLCGMTSDYVCFDNRLPDKELLPTPHSFEKYHHDEFMTSEIPELDC